MKLTATVSPADLPSLLALYHTARVPLFIQGAPGIGKSAITAAYAKMQAGREKRRFLAWNTATESEKEAAAEAPGEWFVFFDLRLSMVNEADIRGLQLMHGVKDHLHLTPPLWVRAFTQREAAGMIFFDEINIAPEYISAMAYQIIHDRVISDRPLGSGVSIVAAGNRVEDAPCLVRELPGPLADRFGQVLMTSSGHTFLDFALRRERKPDTASIAIPPRSETDRTLNPIRPEIITLIMQAPSLLDKRPTDGKLTTERGLERLSKLLDACPDFLSGDEITRIAQSAVGVDAAAALVGYLTFRTELDFPRFLKAPAEYVKELSAKNRSALHTLSEMAAGHMPVSHRHGDSDYTSRLGSILNAVSALPQDGVSLFLELFNARFANRGEAFAFWQSSRADLGVSLPAKIAEVAATLARLRTAQA